MTASVQFKSLRKMQRGLQFVVVALPGLFSYLFLHCCDCNTYAK